MNKNFLILRASGICDEVQECDNIKNQATLFDIQVSDYVVTNNQEINNILLSCEKFDYIYLSSHGNKIEFGNTTSTISYKWSDFGDMLCKSDCMNENCIIMLSCCRGGLNQVAYQLFKRCDNISYIIGPRQSLACIDMLIGYSLFLYTVEKRKIDPVVACERIKAGTDIRFVCFDRLEIEYEIKILDKEGLIDK